MRWQILTALIVGEITYLAVGGAIFYSLEYRSENAEEQSAEQIVNHSNITRILRNFIENGKYGNLTVKHLSSIVEEIVAVKEELVAGRQAANNWNYAGSVFFAITVVTTIGYGNIYPTNDGCRLFCCFYALVGIPLTMVMLLGVGEKLNGFAARLEKRVTNRRPGVGKVGRSLCILLLGFGLFVLIPSAVFSAVQHWPYGISLYYSIISLTTVGFGDYVTGFTCTGSYCSVYRISVGIWIYIGLAWLAGLITSVQDAFQAVVNKVDANPIRNKVKDKLERSRSEHCEQSMEIMELRRCEHTQVIDDDTEIRGSKWSGNEQSSQ